MAATRHHVFVANQSSLTELDSSTGRLVRVISGPHYRFGHPDDVAVGGNNVFVADEDNGSGSIAVINASTGSLRRIVVPCTEYCYELSMGARGAHVFVASFGAASLAEFNATTGKQIRSFHIPDYHGTPSGLAVRGSDLFLELNGEWVAEFDLTTGRVRWITTVGSEDSAGVMVVGGSNLFVQVGNSIKVIKTATGALVRSISGAEYGLDGPSAMAASGNDLFVANAGSVTGGRDSVTRINASTGALVRAIAGPAYQFNEPDALVASDGKLFVANRNGNSVTEWPIGHRHTSREAGGPATQETVAPSAR
jgi:outer membrane protein assembly factor BamB